MRVYELLLQIEQSKVICIQSIKNIFEASEVLTKHKIGALPVFSEDNCLVGIVSERDIVRSLATLGGEILDTPVHEIMTSSLITCSPEDYTHNIIELMGSKKIRHIPVVENGKP